MRRFVWRLQRVLDIKEKFEQAKRTEVLQLAERIAETRVVLLNEQRQLRETLIAVAESRADRRMADQALLLRHAPVNDERIRQLEQSIASLEQQHRARMKELIEMKRSIEAMERLRDRRREQFMEEQQRIEQKELDDRASVTFTRRTRQMEQEVRRE